LSMLHLGVFSVFCCPCNISAFPLLSSSVVHVTSRGFLCCLCVCCPCHISAFPLLFMSVVHVTSRGFLCCLCVCCPCHIHISGFFLVSVCLGHIYTLGSVANNNCS
jgi:hypothetical protein